MKKLNSKNSKKYVYPSDNIAYVIEKYPESAEVFLSFGLHCVGCFANTFDTIEAGCMIHGMDKKEMQELLNEVNYVIGENLKVKNEKKKQ